MSPKMLTAFRIEADVVDGLRRVKDQDGVPLSVQVDRALRAWLEKKGVAVRKPQMANGKTAGRSARRTR
jgi:hypothetical protein